MMEMTVRRQHTISPAPCQHQEVHNLSPRRFINKRNLERFCCLIFGVLLQEWFSTAFMTTTGNNDNLTSMNLSTNSSQQEQQTSVTFLFVVGLEGTGHHLIGSLLQASPRFKKLPVTEYAQLNLHKRLWFHPPNGVVKYPTSSNNGSNWSRQRRRRRTQQQLDRIEGNDTVAITRIKEAPCQQQGLVQQDSRLCHERRKWKRSLNIHPRIEDFGGIWDVHCRNSETASLADTIVLQRELISKLEKIRDKIQKQERKHQQKLSKSSMSAAAATTNAKTTKPHPVGTKTVYYPLNTLPPLEGYGMVSYPNFDDNHCRTLDWPNLDLLYDSVCAKVGGSGITCRHIYLYRDVIDILHSTTIKRKFNPTLLIAMKHYETMYHVLASQVFSPSNYSHLDKTLDCYGLFDMDDPNAKSKWMEHVRIFGGWPDNEEYTRFIGKRYKQPSSLSHPLDTSRIFSQHEKFYYMYLNPLQRLHHHVLNLCRRRKL